MMFAEEYIKNIISIIEQDSKNNNLEYFCLSRDIFQARVDSFVLKTNKYLESAVIGEIGNNTFDHNWDYLPNHVRGTYFNTELYDNIVVLADFGRGIKASLSRVFDARSHQEAVEIAFTKQLSGRAPEQRGNGLKFVADSVKNKKWSLYFQSGDGCCIIENSSISFCTINFVFQGCLAILHFVEEEV
ncbi:MAG: hypothetical protein ACI4LX_11705 [Treponema sp.]